MQLLRFKLHALRCNEAFLLAAEAVAALLAESGAQGAAATRRAAEKWIGHFQPDGPGAWWDVAQQPAAEGGVLLRRGRGGVPEAPNRA